MRTCFASCGSWWCCRKRRCEHRCLNTKAKALPTIFPWKSFVFKKIHLQNPTGSMFLFPSFDLEKCHKNTPLRRTFFSPLFCSLSFSLENWTTLQILPKPTREMRSSIDCNMKWSTSLPETWLLKTAREKWLQMVISISCEFCSNLIFPLEIALFDLPGCWISAKGSLRRKTSVAIALDA